MELIGQTRFATMSPSYPHSTSSSSHLLPTPSADTSSYASNSTFPSNGSSLHNGSSPHNETGPWLDRPKKYHYYASRYSWIWIIAPICLLALLYVVRTIRHNRRRRSQSSRREVVTYKAVRGNDEDDHDGIEALQMAQGGWLTRQWRALGAGWRNILFLHSLPTWLYMPETVADGLWTLLYTVVYSFFSLHNTESWWPTGPNNAANQLGVMSFSQLPIILLLVSKNNPISTLTGITYQKLNYLHRASSRVCLLTAWGHAILWTPRVWDAGDTRPYLLWGIAALTGFTMLWLTSFRVVRRVAYEVFIVAHIIFSILYLVGAYYHWTRLHYWVWPAMAIWGTDRAIRLGRVVYLNNFLSPRRRKTWGESKIELLDRDVMRVTMRRENFNWQAGQHAFISAPSISASPHESHPFSIANVATEQTNEAVFLIRIHSGFTDRLRLALHSDISLNVPLYIEGPYGHPHALDSYSTVLLLAGGTGVTFTSGHFLQILANSRKGESAVKKLHLVWHIRYAQNIEWIAPLLNMAAENSNAGETKFLVDIFVTKSHSSAEPLPPSSELSDRLAALAHQALQPSPGGSNGDPWQSYQALRTTDTPLNESRDETIFLPPRQRAIGNEIGRYGLTEEAAGIVRWNRGRADLNSIVEDDLKSSEGPMNVSVCGPTQLLQASKKAVRQVSTMSATRRGLNAIDFFEETLGV